MSYQVHRYNHRKSTEVRIVEGFFRILWWIISAPFKFIFRRKNENVARSESLDKDFVNARWQEIEQLIALGKPSNNARAVLEADKLLDHVLKSFRAPGMTMGDRLKASRNRFSPEGYDAAWKAHKVRNELVHNSQFELMDYSAKGAIENFKKAINEII